MQLSWKEKIIWCSVCGQTVTCYLSLGHNRLRARPYGKNIQVFVFFSIFIPTYIQRHNMLTAYWEPCSSCKKNGLLIINGLMWIKGYNDLSLLIRCINITANQEYKSTLPIFHWQQCYNRLNKSSACILKQPLLYPYYFTIHISHLLISKA